MPNLVKYPEEEYPIAVNYSNRLPDVLVQTATITSNTISVSGSQEKFLDSLNAMPAAQAGNFLRVSGCSNAQNNGTFTIVNRTSSFIQTGPAPLVDEPAGNSITLQILTTSRIVSVSATVHIERWGTDVSEDLIEGFPSVDPDGTKTYCTITGGSAGTTYLLTITGVPNTGLTHKLIDKYYISVVDRPLRGI